MGWCILIFKIVSGRSRSNTFILTTLRESIMDSDAALFQEAWIEMNQEARDALGKMISEDIIDREGGEFTAKDVIGMWPNVNSISGTKKRCALLVEQDKLTRRRVFDPSVGQWVRAYKIKEGE